METGIVTLYDYSKPIKARHGGLTGPYYFERGPLRDKGDKCQGFSGYLSSDGTEVKEGSMCRLRVKRAKEIVNIRHDGWYTDEFGDADTMEGIVALLPNGRGFLAGWTMGEGMITSFAGYLYHDINAAAWAADTEAQREAAAEREYQSKEREAEEADDEEPKVRGCHGYEA